jgi:electron transfer flavoprotein alpha subunit
VAEIGQTASSSGGIPPLQSQRDEAKGVWFVAEHKEGKLDESSFLLAGEGRGLADKLGEELSVVIIGHQVLTLAEPFTRYGADQALLVQDPILEKYSSYAFVDALTQLVESNRPSMVLLAATPLGNDLAPRLAARLRAALVARYTQIDVEKDKRLLVQRAVHGGKAQATVSPLKKPMVATVDPRLLTTPRPKPPKNMAIVEAKVRIDPKASRTRVLDYLRADPCTLCVSEAEIVIGVGKGLRSADNLRAVEELAHVLGASIGGSRRATDERWIPDERRIGLTGKTIAPRLYMICGISGAFHHTLSIKGSQLMLSVNTDRNAPINKLADMAIVGDMHEIVPELTRQLRDVMKAGT